MIELRRSVRVCVNPEEAATAGDRGRNTFAAWPSMSGLGAWYEFEVGCRGVPDADTGYLLNISEVDAAFRTHALPIVERVFRQRETVAPAELLPAIIDAIQSPLAGRVSSVRWRLTPYYSVAMNVDTRDRYVVRESFEFAAAHRLNCRRLTEAENLHLFGKCNNPSGHGHNYRVEVAVAVPFVPAGDARLDNLEIERLVDETIIRRFDHKNLDLDLREFASVNSSVENIARVCYELLREPMAQRGGELRQVTVWETEKTCCAYPA